MIQPHGRVYRTRIEPRICIGVDVPLQLNPLETVHWTSNAVLLCKEGRQGERTESEVTENTLGAIVHENEYDSSEFQQHFAVPVILPTFPETA
jgi:hypothetical protein